MWGAPRIHGELLKLGINVAPSTVGKYLRRNRRPPSQTWRPFLKNHMKQMASMDFFTVPTAWFRVHGKEVHRRHLDRKSTRLNSSHGYISYAVFCLKKKKKKNHTTTRLALIT